MCDLYGDGWRDSRFRSTFPREISVDAPSEKRDAGGSKGDERGEGEGEVGININMIALIALDRRAGGRGYDTLQITLG